VQSKQSEAVDTQCGKRQYCPGRLQDASEKAYSGPALTHFEDLHQLRMLSLQRLGLTAQLRRLFPSRCRCTPSGGKIRLRPLQSFHLLDLHRGLRLRHGKKCHKQWHYFRVGLGLGHAAHIFGVAGAVALDPGELPLEVPAEMVDDPGTPALLLLARQDLTPNRP
jgi:hypothetical protein